MQFKVPQNIDMADRIVGPLTLVQFLYVLVGGIVVYFLFSAIAPVNGMLFIVTAFPVALFSLAMAFLKVQDQPFPKFVQALIIYLLRPKVRTWHKEGADVALKIVPDKPKPEDAPVEPKKIAKSKLEELIAVMDTGASVAGRVDPSAAKAHAVTPSITRQPSAAGPQKHHPSHGST